MRVLEQIVAAKVWCPEEEAEPEGIVPPEMDAPPNWFREDPAYAAELYVLEKELQTTRPDPMALEKTERHVRVIDTQGKTHDFHTTARVRRELEVAVRPMDGTTTVLINMKPCMVTTPELSYEDVCMFTHGKVVQGLSVIWYQKGRKGEGEKSGMLYHTSPNLKVGPNTHITAVITGSA